MCVPVCVTCYVAIGLDQLGVAYTRAVEGCFSFESASVCVPVCVTCNVAIGLDQLGVAYTHAVENICHQS